MGKIAPSMIGYLRKKGTDDTFTYIKYGDPKKTLKMNPILKRLEGPEDDMVTITKAEHEKCLAKQSNRLVSEAEERVAEMATQETKLEEMTKEELLNYITVEAVDVVVRKTDSKPVIIAAIRAAQAPKAGEAEPAEVPALSKE